jgi:DNA polymerase III delta' subunit
MIDQLLQSLRRGQAMHAYLIAGGQGAPREQTAYQMAAVLLCEGEAADKPCGKCEGCTLFAARTHPDLHILRAPKDKKSIPVDDVRTLEKVLAQAPQRSRKVAIIEEAHRLTPQGQNALLKTLEEPPEGCVLLLTGSEAALLPTIRSRCMILRLPPQTPPRNEQAEELTKRMLQDSYACIGPYGELKREELMDLLEQQTLCAARLATERPEKAGPLCRLGELFLSARSRVDENANAGLCAYYVAIEAGRILGQGGK